MQHANLLTFLLIFQVSMNLMYIHSRCQRMSTAASIVERSLERPLYSKCTLGFIQERGRSSVQYVAVLSHRKVPWRDIKPWSMQKINLIYDKLSYFPLFS